VISANGDNECIRKGESMRRTREHGESKTNLALEDLPMAACLCDAQRVVDLNEAAAELLHAPSIASVRGRTILDLVHPDDRAVTLERLGIALEGGRNPPLQRRILRDDGSIVSLSLSSVGLGTNSGRRKVLVVADQNGFSARHPGNGDDLRMREERFRGLVERGNELIEVLDGEGRIKYATGPVRRIMRMDPQELVGRSVIELFHPNDQALIRSEIERVSADPSLSVTSTARVCRGDGSWRILEGSLSNMLEVPGIEGIVLNLRDVTETLTLREEIERSRRVESLGRLASTMTHEFNNVLMGIQPWVTILDRKFGHEPEIAKIVEHLQRSLQRGVHTTREIRRFTTDVEPSKVTFNAKKWLLKFEQEISSILRSATLRIGIEDEDLTLHADTDLLHHVLVNLVINARDAMPNGGAIEILLHHCASCGCAFPTLSDPDRFAHLLVRDEGVGMRPEVAERIFDPLFTTKKNGTGLGLAVAQQIITGHGGVINVETHPGKGTTFHLFIPSSPDPR
jgi:two-component system, cell cycle sensor histidine kinase and response regulator CckA